MTVARTADTYTAFDYITVHAPRGKEALYRDTYSNFGWEDDGFSHTGRGATELKLKRSRTIRNRQEVLALQVTAEQALDTIEALERSRTRIGSIVAYALGLIGTVFLGLSVFGYQAGSDAASIVNGAVGLVFWVAAPLIHQAIRVSRTARVRPRIAQQMDEIHRACEQADSRLRRVA